MRSIASQITSLVSATDTDRPVSQKAPRLSFLDRYKQMMLAMPPDLDPATRLVLLGLFGFAHDDGGGIYVGTDHLCELTGLSRATVVRRLTILTQRKYLVADGWMVHRPGCRTRMRRLDFAALKRDRTAPKSACNPRLTDEPGVQTNETAGYRQPPAHPLSRAPGSPAEPQTKRDNQESYQELRSWHTSVRLARSELRKRLYSQETVHTVMEITLRPYKQAKNLIGELTKLADVKHPERVFEAIQAAVEGRPIDGAPWLLAYCRRSNWRGFDHAELRREVIKASCPNRFAMTAAELDAYADRELANGHGSASHTPSTLVR